MCGVITLCDLTGVDVPERLTGALVSADFFDILGIAPAHGRLFLAEEDIDGRDRVVVLQHAFWQRKFGGDPTVVGLSFFAQWLVFDPGAHGRLAASDAARMVWF